jgi:phospholipid transport system substrate-binding protein
MRFRYRIFPAGLRLLLSLVLLAAATMGSVTASIGTANAAAVSEASKAAGAKEAETFVQTSIDAGYRILNNKSLGTDERRAQFRTFLLSIVDTNRVAIFTLGNYARMASPSERDRFLAAYDEFAAAMYQGYFDWYTGQILRVANSAVRTPDDVVVYADVMGPNGAPQFKVGFRVRNDESGKHVITDFQFEGVWLALTQRSEFTAFLQQQRGDFNALVSEIQKRTQRFKEAWAPPTQNLAPPISK